MKYIEETKDLDLKTKLYWLIEHFHDEHGGYEDEMDFFVGTTIREAINKINALEAQYDSAMMGYEMTCEKLAKCRDELLEVKGRING